MIHTEEVAKCISHLKKGEIILYPTDTVWGLGCDAKDAGAVEKISVLKQREPEKSFIVLVSDIDMLKSYIKRLHPKEDKLLEYSNTPVTIIYKVDEDCFAPGVVASDKTVGIRLVKSGFSHDLVKAYGSPLVSTSPNISGDPAPENYEDISQIILNGVDYIVNPGLPYQMTNRPSKIAKLNKKGKEFDFLR